MDIYIINTSEAENIDKEVLDNYSHKSITNTKKHKTHCLSYFMLDKILKEIYKIKNRELEFINNKPCLKTREKSFSISHSKELITISISDLDCGADIELIRNRDYKPIAKRMKFNVKSLDDFYSAWTKYEAEYKLGHKTESFKHIDYNGYKICAASDNIKESFEIYILNKGLFSKL